MTWLIQSDDAPSPQPMYLSIGVGAKQGSPLGGWTPDVPLATWFGREQDAKDFAASMLRGHHVRFREVMDEGR